MKVGLPEGACRWPSEIALFDQLAFTCDKLLFIVLNSYLIVTIALSNAAAKSDLKCLGPAYREAADSMLMMVACWSGSMSCWDAYGRK